MPFFGIKTGKKSEMTKKILLGVMTLCMGFQLSADPDRDALKKIVTIIKREFRLIKHPVKPTSWQIYANARDPKLKEKIYSELKKQFKHFNPTARKAELSKYDIKVALQKADTRYPCKTAAEIFDCAEKEAEKEYPLVKKGDDIIIRYYQGGLSRSVEGVVLEVHGDGTAYTVNNRTIQLAWIRKSDRKFFHPEENKRLREKFIENFTRNFADIKKEYQLSLLSEQSKKLIANRENGFFFIAGHWLSVKEIADEVIKRHEIVTEKQNKITKNMHDARSQSKTSEGTVQWRSERYSSGGSNGGSYGFTIFTGGGGFGGGSSSRCSTCGGLGLVNGGYVWVGGIRCPAEAQPCPSCK